MVFGRIIFWCKYDKIFTYVAAMFSARFEFIRTGKSPLKDMSMRRTERLYANAIKNISRFNVYLSENCSEGIRDGSITLNVEPFDKGGNVIMNFEGDDEYIDSMLHIRLRDKIAMRTTKRVIEIKVEKL